MACVNLFMLVQRRFCRTIPQVARAIPKVARAILKWPEFSQRNDILKYLIFSQDHFICSKDYFKFCLHYFKFCLQHFIFAQNFLEHSRIMRFIYLKQPHWHVVIGQGLRILTYSPGPQETTLFIWNCRMEPNKIPWASHSWYGCVNKHQHTLWTNTQFTLITPSCWEESHLHPTPGHMLNHVFDNATWWLHMNATNISVSVLGNVQSCGFQSKSMWFPYPI